MKAVIQSAWLLTTSIGDVVVIIVAESEFFSKQSYEFYLFAGLMVVDMVLFVLIAMTYVYVTPPSADDVTLAEGTKQQESDAVESYKQETDVL
jgi:solute carrier family 15 oligopeptide transporter 1